MNEQEVPTMETPNPDGQRAAVIMSRAREMLTHCDDNVVPDFDGLTDRNWIGA